MCLWWLLAIAKAYQDWVQCKHTRINRVVTELRKAKQMFFRRIQDADSKTLWKPFQILMKKESSIPALSLLGSGMITNRLEKLLFLPGTFQQFQPCIHFSQLSLTWFCTDSVNFNYSRMRNISAVMNKFSVFKTLVYSYWLEVCKSCSNSQDRKSRSPSNCRPTSTLQIIIAPQRTHVI